MLIGDEASECDAYEAESKYFTGLYFISYP
jgi:hypothetical protein